MGDGGYGEPAKPFARWTRDTEMAFLQALRLTGQAKKAALAIGRSPNSAYTYRKRHPEFARAWDEAIAEQQRDWIAAHQERLAGRDEGFGDAGGERLEAGQERAGGWDSRKKGLFLRVLKRTKTVSQACESTGMAPRAAYALRARSPRFAAAWEKALADAPPPSVREAALARAVDGWEEPIVHGGQVVGTRRRYSDGLLRDLLHEEQAREGVGTAAAAAPVKAGAVPRREEPSQAGRATEAELNEALLHNLALLGARLREKRRLKAERQWERWRLGWLDAALAAPTAADLADEEEEDDEDCDAED